MASFNGAAFIEEQVRSILHQIGPEDELIISDDGSLDGTVEILKQLGAKDPRLKFLLGPGRGVVPNFENALRHCRGEVVFLSDQDDIWLPGKVSRVLEEFDDPCVTCVVHDAAVVGPGLTELHESYFDLRGSGPGLFRNWVKVTYLGAAMAFRACLLNVALPIPAAATMHDQWIGSMAEIYGRCIFLGEKLGLYRRHGGNVTALNRRGRAGSVVQKRLRTARLLVASLLEANLLGGRARFGTPWRPDGHHASGRRKDVVTLGQVSLERDAHRLAVLVRSEFEPQLVVGIRTGGAVVAKLMDFEPGTLLMECSMRRPGSTSSGRLGLSAHIAGRIPYAIADALRRLEDAALSRRGPERRDVSPALRAALRDVADVSRMNAVKRVLVVDDAVDSGATLQCVHSELDRALASDDIEIRTCAVVSTREFDKVLESPDYVLYRGLLCRFPWSHDFRDDR